MFRQDLKMTRGSFSFYLFNLKSLTFTNVFAVTLQYPAQTSTKPSFKAVQTPDSPIVRTEISVEDHFTNLVISEEVPSEYFATTRNCCFLFIPTSEFSGITDADISDGLEFLNIK